MNIYDFIPSPDIVAHCQKIGHQFSPLDMAVLVAMSDKTMQERHNAWRAIISEYPDMPIRGNTNFRARNSLHEYLRNFISNEEKLLANFLTPSDCVVYRTSICSPGYHRFEHIGGCFSSFEKAFGSVQEPWNWDDDDEKYAAIRRETIDRENQWYSAQVNNRGAIIRIDSTIQFDWDDALDMVFIDIPIPFEKGDIVTFDGKTPGVLSWMVHWSEEPHLYADLVAGKLGDGFYNGGHCYIITEDGNLTCEYEPLVATHQLRYYTGELREQEHFFEYLSRYMKGTGYGEGWLLSAWTRFHAKAQSDKNSLQLSCFLVLEEAKYAGASRNRTLDRPKALRHSRFKRLRRPYSD